MDKHTFIGKRKVGSTEICDFTDYQGLGHDPLYKRYESVNSIVRKRIDPAFAHFLAAPDYSQEADKVNWYIDDWQDTPERLVTLEGDERRRYEAVKEDTVAHYRKVLNTLVGEELQVMACALRYIDDEFIWCADGKVYCVAWGMTPDRNKHISTGELVHEAPLVEKKEKPVPPVLPPPPAAPELPPPPPEEPVLPPPPPPVPIVAKTPWYKSKWFKWLLGILLALLLLGLLLWMLSNCKGCVHEENGVVQLDSKVGIDGDSIDMNGFVRPIDLVDGRLPDDASIVAPVIDEEGKLPPIIREPGVPPFMGNRLFLFMEHESGDLDGLAEDFKKAYPGDQYSIIGYDREVKSLVIQIPESERDEIRNSLNAKIPNHQFIVFDEQIYEINSTGESPTNNSAPGWHLKAVKAQEAWNITRGSPDVKVAVIDDGIEAGHPIFKGRIVDAYNVYTRNNHLSKGVGHGTHTAGLAVGSLEFLNQGAAGIALDCKLMPVQVIDNGLCPLSALVSGVMYTIHKGADVVNISIGPSFQGLNDLPYPVQDEIARTQFKNVEKLWTRVCRLAADKNTILVFAAGNDDILSSIPPENRTSVAITVGSVDEKLYPTVFTNYGPCTDISAPGKEIYSSFPVNSFRKCDGTSMSAPIVTGAIALMKSLKKDLSVKQAYNVLYKTGQQVYGYMPPMVQCNLALEGVKRGDFSDPEARPMRPVPEKDRAAVEGEPPASWEDPAVVAIIGVLPGDEGGVIGVTDPNTPGVVIADPGMPGDPSSPGNYRQPGTLPATPGNSKTPGATAPVPGKTPDGVAPGNGNVNPGGTPVNEPDYEAIRRLIAKYKKKISELEGQLPENKK